jgi:hypothetical protein
MVRYSVRKETVDGFGEESFDLAEDEMILTAEPRRGNDVTVFIAYPDETDEAAGACGVCGCQYPCDHGCCGP